MSNSRSIYGDNPPAHRRILASRVRSREAAGSRSRSIYAGGPPAHRPLFAQRPPVHVPREEEQEEEEAGSPLLPRVTLLPQAPLPFPRIIHTPTAPLPPAPASLPFLQHALGVHQQRLAEALAQRRTVTPSARLHVQQANAQAAERPVTATRTPTVPLPPYLPLPRDDSLDEAFAADYPPIPPPLPATSRTLDAFLSHHLVPLLPSHAAYPPPGTICAICHDPFHGAHAPILIVDVPSCTGHMFGYQCLRSCIAGRMPNSNKCPLCRTKWFDMDEQHLHDMGRTWSRIDISEYLERLKVENKTKNEELDRLKVGNERLKTRLEELQGNRRVLGLARRDLGLVRGNPLLGVVERRLFVALTAAIVVLGLGMCVLGFLECLRFLGLV